MGRCKASHGRMVKWKGKVVSIAPVLASVSVLALYAGGAQAQVVIDGYQNSQEYVSVDEDVLVTETGNLSLLGGSDVSAIAVDMLDYTSDMTVDGKVSLIIDNQSSAAAISFSDDLSGNLVNTSLIEAIMTGDSRDLTMSGVAVYGDLLGTIDNQGAIDVQILSDSYDGSAAGIYVSGNVESGARIDNSGDIVVSTIVANESSAYSYGVQINGDLNGNVNNSGTIDVEAVSNSSEATAYGIYVGGDLGASGQIVNTGLVTVEARTGSSSDAIAYGIYVGETVYGSIDNQGTIEARAVTGTSSATAYGIYVSGDVEGAISNGGKILVEASAGDSSDAYAYGIYVSSNLLGTIQNDGTIEARAESGTSDASAYGIYVGSDLDGSVINTGKITTEALTGDSSTASAYGIYVSGEVAGSIDNQGTIEARTEAGTSYAYAYGIYAGNLASGASIDNSGTIKVDASTVTSSSAYAYGIYISGDADGTITNSGLIDALAQSGTNSATAYGVYVGGYLSGTIRNTDTGVIKVRTLASESSPDAYGIYVSSGVEVGGLIENAGLIDVVSESIYSEPSAYGIYIDGDMNGTINNLSTGVIEATARSSTSSAESYGVYLSGSLNGTLLNSGRITATAESLESSAEAYGIYVSGSVSGLLENSGTIEARADSDDSTGTAYGIYVSSNLDLDASIVNSGTIKAESHVESYYAYATGVEVGGTVDGTLKNLAGGTIDVLAESGTDYAGAWGIYVSGGIGSTAGLVGNDGLIKVAATSSADGTYVESYGVDIRGTNDGLIANTGTIEVEANNSSAAYAYGISVSSTSVDGSIVNSGSIHADASSESGSAEAYGVNLREFNGTFTNTGTITAHEDGDLGTAIYASGDTGLVRLATNGWIEGYIAPQGDVDVDVIGAKGASVHWTVDQFENGGSYSVNDTGENGLPVAVRYNVDSVEYATYDASILAAQRQGVADAGFVGGNVIAGQAGAAALASAPQATRGPVGSGGFTPFVSGAFKSATYAGNDVTLDQEVTTGSAVVGGTFAMDSGLLLGVAAGALRGTADVTGDYGPSAESSSTGGFAAVGLAGTSGALRFSAALSAGKLNHDTTRYVNDNLELGGIAAHDASYGSDFVAAQLGLSGRLELGDDTALVPMTVLRYARHSVDGYEDGLALVDAQNFGVFEGEIGVSVEKAMGPGIVTGGLSLLSRNFTGDEATSINMIGDDVLMPSDLGVGTFAKVSIGYATEFGSATQVRVGAETLLDSDGLTGGQISGEVRFSF